MAFHRVDFAADHQGMLRSLFYAHSSALSRAFVFWPYGERHTWSRLRFQSEFSASQKLLQVCLKTCPHLHLSSHKHSRQRNNGNCTSKSSFRFHWHFPFFLLKWVLRIHNP
jgi:hypothetical protein